MKNTFTLLILSALFISQPVLGFDLPGETPSIKRDNATDKPMKVFATFTVSNLNDTGAGSFRQALLDANNNNSSPNVIDATGVTGTINLETVLPDINCDVTINGPLATAGSLILNRNSLTDFGILRVNTSKTVTINDLVITNGKEYQGAGIQNYGNLTLNRILITGCTVTSGTAAAVQNDGTIVMNNCVLVKNTGSTCFESYGTTNVFNNCTIGDYIRLLGDDATLVMKNSLIHSIYPAEKVIAAQSSNNFILRDIALEFNYNNNILNQLPQFVNKNDVDGADNIYRTADDGFALEACSPGINKGTNTGVSVKDIADQNRIFGTTVDIGAYELQSTPITPLLPPTSPFANTQVCHNSDTILTASCTYGQVDWYAGGTYISTGTSFSVQSYTPIISNTPIRVYCAYPNSSCQSDPIVIFDYLPSPPSGAVPLKSVFCESDTVKLYANCDSQNTRWYDQPTGGTLLGTGATLITTEVLPSRTYYAACATVDCESNRIPVQIRTGTNTRKYVKHDAIGNNDGSSWANAYTDLQSALDVSCGGTEIWVAKGTYFPTASPDGTNTDLRNRAFHFNTTLLIYGGFAGNETLLSQRNIATNPTILSGDFNNDDIVTGEGSTLSITNNGENAYHVLVPIAFFTDRGIVIDGFTIKGGNANATGSIMYEGYPFMIYHNNGGGIFTMDVNYIVTGVNSVTINNVTLTENSAMRKGGGFYSAGINEITNSKFLKNKALVGAGAENSMDLELNNVVFEGNHATYKGGGVSSDSTQRTIVNRVYFRNNYAQHMGGGFAHEGGDGSINNAVFVGNSAGTGGAAFILLTDNYKITNCTIAKNTATNGGGVVYSNMTNLNLKNTIIWDNLGTSSIDNIGFVQHPIYSTVVLPIGTPTLTQTNSLIEGFGAANGNIDANPQFNNENDADGADNTFFTTDDGFNLTACSPAINMGTNTGIEATDILNNPRPYNSGTADIGAFEFSGLPVPSNVSVSQTTICTPTNIMLSATCAIGTITWYNQATGGSVIGTGSPISQLVSQGSTFYVSCKDNCSESSRVATPNISVGGGLPPVVPEPNPSVCISNSIILSASCPAGTINWYSSIGTTLLYTGSMYSTPNLSVNTNYKVRCEEVSCFGPFVDVTVSIAANPTAQISGSDNLTCITTSVTRTASGGASYQWSAGLGTNAVATIGNPGTYTVTVTGTNGCTATATTSVTRNITPPTASISGSDNLTCATPSVSRTASGGGTYQWSNSLGTNPMATINAPGTYTITVTSANGCTATATTSVTRNTTPPTASISGSDNLTCATPSVTRTASGGGTYQWSNGLGTNAMATINAPGTYTVTVTGANGCTATATTTVTQDGSLPTASISGSDNLICTTTSVTRTASGGVSYQWSGGLGTNAVATINAPGTYTVTVTGGNGCTATATTSVTRNITPPMASISGSDNLTCATPSVSRTASGGGTYQWSNGLGTNAMATINAPGTYTATVTGANGCTATATAIVTRNITPPTASISGADNLACGVTTVTRTASGGGTYQWSNGLGTNAAVNISSAGTYTVTVTGANGCTATATTQVLVTDSASVTASNTGPYTTGQTIQLNASGGGSYAWSGPNNFTSSAANPTIANALAANAGIYTVTVTNNVCTATATTQVIVNGSDPCAQIIDLVYVKAGNPYQPMFSLKDGMVIQQTTEAVSIMAVPICQSTPVGSVDLTIVGTDLNWTILQNVQPFTIFDNLGVHIYGRELPPGTYTFTVTGYLEDNRIGGTVYGPVVTTFTIVGNSAGISAPTVSNHLICSGGNVNVTFSTTGSFAPSNEFQVQLSDINGTFVNPTIIGISNTAGTIACQIPADVAAGSSYLVRVVSTNQVIAGNPTNTTLSIIPAVKNFVNDVNGGTVSEQASQKITATHKTISSANVSYKAGKAIELNPGFAADKGVIFKAEIGGCNN